MDDYKNKKWIGKGAGELNERAGYEQGAVKGGGAD